MKNTEETVCKYCNQKLIKLDDVKKKTVMKCVTCQVVFYFVKGDK